MVVVVVVVSLLVAFVGVRVLIRRRRRRLAGQVYVPTYPTIELEQPYGGWDADPGDADPGHGQPRLPYITQVGPPSSWGRLY